MHRDDTKNMRHLPNEIVVRFAKYENLRAKPEPRQRARAKRPRIEGEARTDGEGRGRNPSSEALTASEGRSPGKSATAGVTRCQCHPGNAEYPS